MFGAGTDTAAITIEWALSEMLKNPQVMKRAQDEVRKIFKEKGNVDESDLHKLKYLEAIIKETLRLHVPAPLLLPRECIENCKINNYDISKNTRVIINAWAIGRDSRYWNEAEKFIPERFLDYEIDYRGNDFKYIPFGAGRRICPGVSFAVANMELPLAQLLYHFDWKLPNEQKLEELDMTERFGSTTRRRNDLFLVPIPSSHSSVLFK